MNLKIYINKILRLFFIGIAIFVISVVGILVARGMLNKSNLPTKMKIQRELSQLRKIPLVGRFAPKPPVTKKSPIIIDSFSKIDTCVKLKPFSSAEISAFVSRLKEKVKVYEEKEKLLEEKEKRLEFLQEDINAQKQELDLLKQNLVEIRQAIEEERKALDKRFIEFKEVEKKNMKSLAEKYQSIKPDKAAAIMKNLDENTAIKLLALMEERQAARILSAFEDTKFAASLIEKMKGLAEDGS